MTEKTFWIKQTGSNLVNENLIVSTRYHIDTETGRYHSVTLFDGGLKQMTEDMLPMHRFKSMSAADMTSPS